MKLNLLNRAIDQLVDFGVAHWRRGALGHRGYTLADALRHSRNDCRFQPIFLFK